jgi:hypothetical protein
MERRSGKRSSSVGSEKMERVGDRQGQLKRYCSTGQNPQRAVAPTEEAYLYEAQHVSGDTQPIIRSLKLHWQPLVFHTWKVVGRVVSGRCQAQYVPDNVHQLHV